jgi:small subunit ribosomal protein S1
LKDLEEGEVVKGVIVSINNDEVLVDVGYKSEGSISTREFPDPSALKVGQEIEVYLDKKEDQDGVVVLSKEKADFYTKWDKIKEYYENDQKITGKILEVVKGGLSVDIGVRAFLPASQVALRPIKDLESMVGQTIEFKIVKLNKRRRNIVLSRKVILAEAREELKKQLVNGLQEGQTVEGEVKNITDFGAFVDIGGLDGLLHLTDLTWGRITHPSEVVHIGDRIKVKVLSFDRERERVSLGLKQLSPHPWQEIDQKFNVGDVVRGKIVSVTDYGAFMELEKGIEGLIHISEMSWTKRIKHPSEFLEIGDTVEAMILNIDKENERISLGLRQLEPNPWDTLEERYPVGKRFQGKIRNITDFGIFVQVEEGIDGLVHISDISWTSRIQNPADVFTKGQEVEVVVLGIDKINRRVSLGMKQLTEDPWVKMQEVLKVGQNVEGEIIKIANYGAIIHIPFGIEGLLHVSEIDERHIENVSEILKVGQRINLKIISISPEERKVSLSIREFEREKKEKGDSIEVIPLEDVTPIKETLPIVKEAAEEETVPVSAEEQPAPVEEEKPAAEPPSEDEIEGKDKEKPATEPSPETKAEGKDKEKPKGKKSKKESAESGEPG